MEEKEYKFDACISYRHCKLDKFVAENLHRILETYELPKNIKEKLKINSKTIRRVFRDQEELPLSSNLEDPIISALENSKYLIVICSPRLKDSLWCKKEIETFKKLRGRKNIFCVLIEGEPADSFPEEVLFDEQEVTLENGEKAVERIEVEPLAADVRGQTEKEVLKKIKEEKLRLIAPMYGLDYDDLKQRHKLRRQKRILNISIITAIACFIFAIYTSIMLIKINSQQDILKHHQALTLASKASEYIKEDNRYEAVKNAYQALVEFEGVKMPYTPEAEYALSESLGIYDIGASYKAVSQINTKGVVDFVKSSPNGKYAAVYDESEEITLFDTNTLNIILKYNMNNMYTNDRMFGFVGNDIFAFSNRDTNISLVKTETGELLTEINNEGRGFISLRGSTNGEYLAYTDYEKVYIYDVKENKQIGSISEEDNFLKDIYYSEDCNYVFVATLKENYDIYKEDSITVYVIDAKEGKKINSINQEASSFSGVVTKDNNAYILLNNRVGTDVSMIILSYDYINGNVNWTKIIENAWGKYITRSYAENTNNIAIVNQDNVNILNADNGEIETTFNTSSEILTIYTFTTSDLYITVSSDGTVDYMDVENKNSIEFDGKYELNLDEYVDVEKTENGLILLPYNENRVIIYDEKANKDAKLEDISLDYPKKDDVSVTEQKQIIEDYDIINKNLISNIIYDSDKKLIFVNYKNADIAIYNVETKELIKLLNNVGKINHYFGKDKNDRIYIGDISDTYILDNDFNKVGHIKGLRKLEEDKVIIANNSKFYSLKIYNLNELLNEAKELINNKNNDNN